MIADDSWLLIDAFMELNCHKLWMLYGMHDVAHTDLLH